MNDDILMNRLHKANPYVTSPATDDRLREEILGTPPDPSLAARRRTPRRRERASINFWHIAVRGVTLSTRWATNRWLIGGAMAALAVALVIMGLPSSSSPDRAHAFPVLDEASTLTPVALGRALEEYGAPIGNYGLDIHRGRPFRTPWGTGYVLTNHRRSVICAAAPGSRHAGWWASCARMTVAAHQGTGPLEFGYNMSSDTMRLVMLLPAGATAAVQAPNEERLPAQLHKGVLALVVRQNALITTDIGGRISSFRVLRADDRTRPAPTEPTPETSHTTTTTATVH